jgi:hypothetical protein
MVIAIARIHGDAGYLEPILQATLDVLRPPRDGETPERAAAVDRPAGK